MNKAAAVLIVIAMSHLAGPIYAWSYSSDVFTIADAEVSEMSVRMAGDYVVWQDSAGDSLHGYDLTRREGFLISPGGVDSMSLLMNGDYVVWRDSMAMETYCFDLERRERFAVVPAYIDGAMQLTGRFFVFTWLGSMALFGVDLESREPFVLGFGEIEEMSVRAAGDYMVWTTMMDGGVQGYNLPQREGFVITADSVDSMSLMMNEQLVAWHEMPGMEPFQEGVFGYDLATRSKFLVTAEDVDSMTLRILGRHIIYRSMMSGVLYGYDTLTHETFAIPAGSNVDMWNTKGNERYFIWLDPDAIRLYGYDLVDRRLIETGIEVFLEWAVLSGSYVLDAFHDPAEGIIHAVRGYDLATGQTFIVAPLAADAPVGGATLVADGDHVGWLDWDEDRMGLMLQAARIWKLPNDECADAVEVFAGQAYDGDSSGAVGTAGTCAFGDWRDVYHLLRPAAGGPFTISVGSGAFDTSLTVLNACDGQVLACNDDCNLQTTDSCVTMTLVKGKRYLLRVAGADGAAGPYQLLINGGTCAESLEADITGDCRVNLADLAVVSAQWLRCGLEPASLCQQ